MHRALYSSGPLHSGALKNWDNFHHTITTTTTTTTNNNNNNN
jgi:hypothetical protein